MEQLRIHKFRHVLLERQVPDVAALVINMLLQCDTDPSSLLDHVNIPVARAGAKSGSGGPVDASGWIDGPAREVAGR